MVAVVGALPEGLNRVTDGAAVELAEAGRQYLGLEPAHVAGVKGLAQQVVGLHRVVVHQEQLHLRLGQQQPAQALRHQAAGAAAARHRDARAVVGVPPLSVGQGGTWGSPSVKLGREVTTSSHVGGGRSKTSPQSRGAK